MAKPNTKCRVCGKEYFCCADHQRLGGWKTMACSEEHYKEYMRRVAESRKPTVKEALETPKKRQTKIKPEFHVLEEVKIENSEENSSEE